MHLMEKGGNFYFMQHVFYKKVNFKNKFNDRDFCIINFTVIPESSIFPRILIRIDCRNNV